VESLQADILANLSVVLALSRFLNNLQISTKFNVLWIFAGV